MTIPESKLELITTSPEETEELGAHLATLLCAGQGVALDGEMGTGKTVITRGIARGLGVEGADEVSSPSYLLMIEYPGPKPLYHFDAYFAAKERDFLADGGEVLLEGDGVAVVEWAKRLGEMIPPHFLQVEIQAEAEDRRRFTFRGTGGNWQTILADLSALYLNKKTF